MIGVAQDPRSSIGKALKSHHNYFEVVVNESVLSNFNLSDDSASVLLYDGTKISISSESPGNNSSGPEDSEEKSNFNLLKLMLKCPVKVDLKNSPTRPDSDITRADIGTCLDFFFPKSSSETADDQA